MWGNAVEVVPEGHDVFGGISGDPQGVWVDDSTFALFWIQTPPSTGGRFLWMQRFLRTGMQLSADGDPINLCEIPITQPNPGDDAEMHLTVAPDGEVLVSFLEESVIFG